ncbi:protein NRT1/ PTR FAMILY 8.1 isoform X2 [Cryptomeria japonica]|uniref:protein NRT1/ PTR FAMILY 8.1 isoform X2 n=1 Tax=Cryptomeria japonica TaxID=3369 RepID=UPI0027DAA9F2|nr:protein NRT1/ PTR FAMILY 8.1 isoform X2 [Cryptomeria japonica]
MARIQFIFCSSVYRLQSTTSEMETELTENNSQVKKVETKSEVLSVHSNDEITQDGSVDMHGNPSIKKKSGNWKACPFILGNECCVSLAYCGININMVNYLIKCFHQGNSTAANTVNNWAGTCSITPLIGAFMADSYWGRYWTIAVFSTIYFIGMTLLTISAFTPSLKPLCKVSDDDHNASTAQTGVFFLALYLVALGTGGITPCVSSFGADQFDETDDVEKKKKSSFFNWYYFSINIGALLSSSVLVWIQDNVGWGWGFGIPTVALAVAIFFFFSGTLLYRHQKPGGSALTRIAQVIVASFRKRHIQVPDDNSLLYEVQDKESSIEGSRKLEHTDVFLFLDKAATETDNEKCKVGNINPWRLCTVTQVEELKSIIRMFPIWASVIIFSTAYSQMSTLFVEQGDTMDVRISSNFKIPPASLIVFDILSVMFWVPVYDFLIVPLARKYTGNQRGFTHLQRMGMGLVISIFAMVVAAFVEIKRLKMVAEHNYYERSYIPMSIFWQIPQYFIIGAAEIFTYIGQIEFFYDQAPDAMRSLGSALALTTQALGSYLSSLLVTIVTHITTRHGKRGWIPDNLNYGHIDYFFWLLAILSFLNFLVYLLIANWYVYKKPTGAPHISKQGTQKAH